MREFIVRCENNKFTLEGEIVHCKDCGHRIVTDWYKYDERMTRSVYDCDKNIINDNKDSDHCSYGERKAVTEETDTDPDEVVDFNSMINAGGKIRNLLNGVAQIKVNTDEIVKRIKEKYETTDCPVCEDTISRQAAIEAWNKLSKRGRTEFDQVLMMLPPVAPTEQQNKEKEHDGKSICHTCATNNCPFQSGIYRNNCDFYTSVNKRKEVKRNGELAINTVEKPDINTTEQGRSPCNTCRYSDRFQTEEPCFSCISGFRSYEPVEQQKESLTDSKTIDTMGNCRLRTVNGWCGIFNKSCKECISPKCKSIKKAYRQGRVEAKYFSKKLTEKGDIK